MFEKLAIQTGMFMLCGKAPAKVSDLFFSFHVKRDSFLLSLTAALWGQGAITLQEGDFCFMWREGTVVDPESQLRVDGVLPSEGSILWIDWDIYLALWFRASATAFSVCNLKVVDFSCFFSQRLLHLRLGLWLPSPKVSFSL